MSQMSMSQQSPDVFRPTQIVDTQDNYASVVSHSSNWDFAKESNFKVVIRVRPPLKREMPTKSDRDENGHPLKFLPCTDISEDAKYCTLLEYLGSEVSEKGR